MYYLVNLVKIFVIVLMIKLNILNIYYHSVTLYSHSWISAFILFL